jgi:hypothetical protein
MAIVIEGASECPLCKKVLDESSRYLMFPPLVSNVLDTLFIFSDSGVHADCLDADPRKALLLQHAALYYESLPPAGVVCITDGQLIDGPGNLLSWGLLTSDKEEELYRYNFISLNRKNIHYWQEKDRFVSVAEKFLQEGKWESLTDFNLLVYIIKKLENGESIIK